MATLQEYFNRYDRIRSRLSIINGQITFLNDEVRRGAVLGDPDNVGRRADAIDSQIDSAIDGLNALSEEIASSDLTPSQQESLQRVIEQTGEGYLDAQQRLLGVRRGAEQNTRAQQLREQSQPRNSAGDIVDNEQDAQKADAKVQSPQQEDLALDNQGRVVAQPNNTNTATNARTPNIENDAASNVDDAVIGNQAQGGAISVVGGDTPPVKAEQTQRANNTGNVAATAANEDAFIESQPSTATAIAADGRPEVAREFLEPIISKPNLLSGLSSMTYGLSLYLMSPDDLGEFVEREQKTLPSKQLLMQSAGAAKEERNEWFNVDFYIEDFSLESVVGTQATGSPHNAITLEFTVLEPQGITFLNRLNNAVIDYIGQSSDSKNKPAALSQNYMMVIRFYGYDAAGNSVTAAELGLETTTDSSAIIEKFIPFTITNFNYKIQSKVTEYRIKGACLGTNVAFSTARGVIPFNLQVTASTIDQLFNGNLVISETQNEDPANAGNSQSGTTQTVVQGLTQALNEQQLRMAGESAEIPDQYEIIFQDPALKNAKIVKPGSVSKTKAANQTAEQSARKYLTSKLNYDKESQTYSILAGTQIVQLIDLLLRNSTYITSQQNVYIDEKTGKVESQTSSVPTVQWYRVKTKVTPLGYDNVRNTMAYKISYYVNKYQINSPRSAYFPTAEYRGVHKLYEYWFTGQNTEVLDFEIDVNYNYFLTIGNDGRVDSQDQGDFPIQQFFSVTPGQTQQGGENGSTIPAANLSDRLYSYADIQYANIDIVGDPDWIQQNELVYNKTVTLSPFLPDGGVNYDGSEVLFEIRFNPVVDYDLATGLSNVYENNREFTIRGPGDTTVNETQVAQENLVYSALTVTSNFSEGKFTQRLNGVYKNFNSAKNAPVNPQARKVLSTGNSVERTLADTTTVGGVETNAGGAGNRDRAQNQRNNLNNGTPKTSVTTRNVVGGRSASARNGSRDASTDIVVEIVPNDQFPDEDAGTESTRRIGGRSAAARN